MMFRSFWFDDMFLFWVLNAKCQSEIVSVSHSMQPFACSIEGKVEQTASKVKWIKHPFWWALIVVICLRRSNRKKDVIFEQNSFIGFRITMADGGRCCSDFLLFFSHCFFFGVGALKLNVLSSVSCRPLNLIQFNKNLLPLNVAHRLSTE